MTNDQIHTEMQQTSDAIYAAAREFVRRQARLEHPDGEFDRVGRFYPSEDEFCDCCEHIRSPSRAHPHTYNTHCRTMIHIATKYGLNDQIAHIRRAVKDIRQEQHNV